MRLVLFITSLLACCSVTSAVLRKVGSFKVAYPAFLTFRDRTDTSQGYDLLISTFGAGGFFSSSPDSVRWVKNIGQYMNNVGAASPELITSKVTWPNEVSAVPKEIFGKEMIAIPDGFLVPFKTSGAIKLMDVSGAQPSGPFTLTDGNDGDWFYHRVKWHDMDGDGDLDIVTCRAREPIIPLIFGREDEELVWLENPSGVISHSWKPHVLAHGPDIFFRYTTLNTTDGPSDCIITSQFFTKSLSVYWTIQSNGLYTDTSMMRHRVIDNTIGAVFEVELVDLNRDGNLDLLVTTNGNNGTLLAYEIPSDFRTGNFVKHVIATGFTPRKSGTGKGAPGKAAAIQPTTTGSNMKPSILMSGDDDGRAYLFEAVSQDASDWRYVKTTFDDTGDGTVGEIAHADVDGDGYTDIFVPAYSNNEVDVYTFAP